MSQHQRAIPQTLSPIQSVQSTLLPSSPTFGSLVPYRAMLLFKKLQLDIKKKKKKVQNMQSKKLY